MQNIYVYDPYGKVGKLIWYKGRAFYSYVVTYNHSQQMITYMMVQQSQVPVQTTMVGGLVLTTLKE